MSATAPLRRLAPLAVPRQPAAPGRTAAPTAPTPKSRPRLVLSASKPVAAGRLAFLILVGAVLSGGLVAVLMLHTLAAQDAFRVTALQQRLSTLTDQVQQAQQVVAADSSPTALQKRAKALGMVPTVITTFHRHGDGRAVAVQTPVYVAPSINRAPADPAGTSVTSSTSSSTSAATATTTTTKTSTKSQKTGTKSQKTGTKSQKTGTKSQKTAPPKTTSKHHRHQHTTP
jgi:hypothetical protein